MSRKKYFEKELALAREELKEAFNFISRESLDIEEVKEYLLPYQIKIDHIKEQLKELK
jgi:hypothetical protein